MEECHSDDVLQNPAADRLRQFIRERRQKQDQGLPDFETFERELHEQIMALEREFIAEELKRYDVDAEQVEVGGVVYHRAVTCSETYLCAAGPVSIERHLYRPAGRSTRSICPLELRAGIVGGQFTPRAARQATFVTAHLTCREGEMLFKELGGMCPSRSSLDRLPKVLSEHWEASRQAWEEALRSAETVACQAAVLAVSLDGVMAPLKDAGRKDKRSQPDKQPKGPSGYGEVGCGTVALYDAEGERLDTVRYGRMPQSKKATLCQQLQKECQSILLMRPDLKVVKLADGAKDNWRFLGELDLGLGARIIPQVEIVDFYHACEHLKRACDAVWGEGNVQGKAEFERLKTLLKEADDGVDKVIGTFQYRQRQARGRRKKRIKAELTYFRNGCHRMHYAQYIREHLPIASGVVEAACKTLVTQRMKCSGMAWTQKGGQAILTFRSLIQSQRWERAWSLLHADFCQTVTVVKPKHRASPSLAA